MKKLITLLLLASMLIQLCACGTGSSVETEATTEAPVETGETRTPHQIPDEVDFGGETFSAAFLDGGSKSNEYYYQDESSSDVMDASVYRRTVKTEDFLGIDIVYTIQVSDSEYRTLYKSGDDLYQQLFVGAFPLSYMTEGYLLNLEELPYVDMQADWWNYTQVKQLQLGQYPYFAVCDFMITTPMVLMFNRNMIEDNQLENPYTLVDNGTWTLDKYIEMSGAVINDKDGDGEYISEDDVVGGVYFGNFAVALMTGCDQYISAKNEEGRLEMTLNSEKTLDIIDKLIGMRTVKGSYTPFETSPGKFSGGKALFRGAYVSHISEAANYDFNTGVLPPPKYNAEQENYLCYDVSNLMAISGTTKNKELVGATLEFLAWDSKNEVFPTYYDVLLKTRYSQDMETRHMLDIIFDSIAYEVGGTFFAMQPGFCELWYIGDQVLLYGLNNFSSFWRVYKGPANQTINTFYDALNKVEGIAEETTAE